MSTLDLVLRDLKPMIADVLGLDAEEVTPAARFFQDLGGESIDLLDLSFRAEKHFQVRVPVQRLAPSGDLVTDAAGVLTPESLVALKTQYSFLNYREFEKHPAKERLRDLLTVEAIAQMITNALSARDAMAVDVQPTA